MHTKTMMVALISAFTLLACATEEGTADESADVPVEVAGSDAVPPPHGENVPPVEIDGLTPTRVADGWCVFGYHFGRNWSYCCYDNSGCEFWSQ